MPRKKRIAMDVINIEVKTSWSGSSLIFQDFAEGEVINEAVINVREPHQVEYIGERLNEIVAGWESRMKTVRWAAPATGEPQERKKR